MVLEEEEGQRDQRREGMKEIQVGQGESGPQGCQRRGRERTDGDTEDKDEESLDLCC